MENKNDFIDQKRKLYLDLTMTPTCMIVLLFVLALTIYCKCAHAEKIICYLSSFICLLEKT